MDDAGFSYMELCWDNTPRQRSLWAPTFMMSSSEACSSLCPNSPQWTELRYRRQRQCNSLPFSRQAELKMFSKVGKRMRCTCDKKEPEDSSRFCWATLDRGQPCSFAYSPLLVECFANSDVDTSRLRHASLSSSESSTRSPVMSLGIPDLHLPQGLQIDHRSCQLKLLRCPGSRETVFPS